MLVVNLLSAYGRGAVLIVLFCLTFMPALADDALLTVESGVASEAADPVAGLDAELNILSAKSLIESIKSSEDFGGKKTLESWRFKTNDSTEEEAPVPQWLINLAKFTESFGQVLAFIPATLEVILWIAAALLIAVLIYIFRNAIRDFVRPQREQAYEDLPVSMFGLDIRKESLPGDIIAEVQLLLAQERYREAVGLLYRATISRLIHQHQFEFHAGNTEGECAAIVRKRNDAALFRYFDQLTRCWKQLAYGHTVPSADTLDNLCSNWRHQFDNVEQENQAAPANTGGQV